MASFIIRRILTMIPMIFGITLMVFFLMYLSPGDFLDELRSRPDVTAEFVQLEEARLGLDKPWYVQYSIWLNNVSPIKFGFLDNGGDYFVKFGKPDLMNSFAYQIPVFDLLLQRLPATFLLSLTSLTLAWSIAIPLGVLAAIYKDSIFDRLSSILSFAALSIPEFFLAILAVQFAAVSGLFPVGGYSSIGSEYLSFTERFFDTAYHLILPTIVLGIGSIASMMRVMRANFIDYMHAEFATTTRAKGLSEFTIMFKHVLRNAINPLITAFGFSFASLLSGAVLVERVMNYPGLGLLLYNSVLKKDAYVVIAGVVMGCVMLMLGNLLADILLAWIDPRSRSLDKGNSSTVSVRWKSFVIPFLMVVVGLIFFQWIEGLAWGEAEFREDFLHSFSRIAMSIIFVSLGFFLWMSRSTVKLLIVQIPKYPAGFIALLILIPLYVSMVFAPAIVPYVPGKSNLTKTFHPPSGISLTGEGLHYKIHDLVDPTQAKYSPDAGKTVPLKWFGKGEPYQLFFGLMAGERHLFLPDYSQLNEEGLTDKECHEQYPFYLLGSDSTGRDVFSRLLYGSQISLSIGFIGISITMVIGFLVGGLSGFFGGVADFVTMRVIEFLMAIPGLYLLLILRASLSDYFDSSEMYTLIIIILAFIGWSGTARIIRGMTLSFRNRQFVNAAESMGQKPVKILVKHVLPNITSYLLVAATLSIPGYILGEAALSFLGLGIMEPEPSWGLMLKQAQEDFKVLMLNFWWLLSPGFMIFITVISFNVLGDALRDIVDPKMKV